MFEDIRKTYALVISIIYALLDIVVCHALDDYGWFIVLLIPLAGYFAVCYFGNSVDPEDEGYITCGGEAVKTQKGEGVANPGFHMILAPFFSLDKERRRMQFTFSPDPHSHTATQINYTLRPVQFVGKDKSSDPYERQVTTTPSLVLTVDIDNEELFFRNAETHMHAGDLLCEVVNAALFEQTQGPAPDHKGITLREFIRKLGEIEEAITMEIATAVEGIGLKMIGAGHHAGIQITNPGVPAEVVAAEKAAMAAATSVATAKAEGTAKKEKDTEAADGIRATGQANADTEKAMVAALPGTDKEKAEILKAREFGKAVAAHRGPLYISFGGKDGMPIVDMRDTQPGGGN